MSNHSQHAAGGNLAVPSIDCASLFSWAAYHGLYLFPIPRGRKAPVGLVRSWSKEASNDPTQWCAWARQFPGCNFGVACKQSGLAVLDIDVKTAGRDAAWRAVHAWWWRLTGTDLPRDALVTTPSGGYHIYFRDPLGQVGNRAKIEGLVGILDIRGGANGDGGYVVSPYSHTDVAVGDGDVKASGWYVPSQSFSAPCPVQPFPATIPELPAAAIAAVRQANLDTPKFDVSAERAVVDAMPPDEREAEARRRAQRADQLIEAVANAPEGRRNDSLFAASVEIGKGAGLGLLDADEYNAKLTEAAALSGLGDGRDVRSTIRSAGNYVKDGKAGDNTVRTAERIFGGGSATPSSPLAGDDADVFADETAYPTTQDQELARMPVTESVIRAARRAGLDPHAALAATTTLASHALSQRFDTTVDGLPDSKPTPLTSLTLAVAPVGGGKSMVVDAVCGDIKSSLEAMRNERQRQVGKFLSVHKAAAENHISAPPLNVLKPDMCHSPNTTAQNFVDTVDDWQPVTTIVTPEGNQIFAANRGNNFDALSIAMVQAWDGRIEKQSRVRKDIARKQAVTDRSDLEGIFGREVRFSMLLMQQTGNHEALLNDVLVSRAFESSGFMSRIGIFKCEEMTDTGVPITADLFADVQARIKLLYEVCKPKIKRTASYWIEKADAKPKPGRPDKGAVREVKAPKGMSVFTFDPGGSTTSSHAAAIGGRGAPSTAVA